MFRESMNESYDVVIVPGVPFNNGEWSRIMKARVYWSQYLYEKGMVKNIIYSGSAVYSPYYEAEIMALYAKAIGVPEEVIFTETRAEHSTENAYYSYQLAKELGFKTVALSSDPYQTKMLSRYVRRNVSKEVRIMPIIFDTLRTLHPIMIDPEIEYHKALDSAYVSLYEREGFFKRLKGTMGRNIEFVIESQDHSRRE